VGRTGMLGEVTGTGTPRPGRGILILYTRQ